MSVETEIVNISITQDTLALQRAGFGVPLLVSYGATFPERVRYYSGLDGLVTDGFSTTSIEYRTATALISQERRPTLLGIGHASNKPTARFTIRASALSPSGPRLYVINGAAAGFARGGAPLPTDSSTNHEKLN